MQKCPRCELLLLDTDTECPRCHATVTQIMTPEQAAEARRKELAVYQAERARVLAAGGDYIPPWAPVGTMAAAPLVFSLIVLAHEIFKNMGQPMMWFLLVLMSFVMFVAIAISGGIVWGGVFLFERKPPGIDRALLTVGILFMFAAAPLILFQFVGYLFPVVVSPGVMSKAILVCLAFSTFLCTRGMFELEAIQAILLTAACTGYYYIMFKIVAGMLGGVAAKIPDFAWPFIVPA